MSDLPPPISTNGSLGRLILRLAIGGLMIFHGIHKLVHGFEAIGNMLTNKGLPQWLMYGVPLGEIVAPVLILLGVATRISSLAIAVTMGFAIYLAFGNQLFSLTENGGLVVELNLFFILASISLFFLGSGQHSLYKGDKAWLK